MHNLRVISTYAALTVNVWSLNARKLPLKRYIADKARSDAILALGLNPGLTVNPIESWAPRQSVRGGTALELSNPQVAPGIIPKADIAIGCT
jgi:hypothetical protein